MKLSSGTTVFAAILVVGLLQTTDSLFLSSLTLLPISAIVSLGGIGGLKLAIAMKILGMLGWWDVSRGTKGSMTHASGELKSPLVNVEAQKTATLRGRRNIETDPLVIKEAVQLVHDLDTDHCLLRLSCEVSADPSNYGTYGRRVAAFMNGVGPIGSDSAFVDFEKANNQGRSSGVSGCAKAYPSCVYDLRALVALVESL
ncbi:hypothetical protein HPB49_022486 [Dermacentor silvarum]|uniref:Uncharacterized protein n=1 Tax=Dermacentor silvarum TaxID=543639 RepID=A0ACB8E3W1_DERSI|nr:hypothetical protein HPB49_022486 [Dermacentor silvarum]